MWHTDQLILEVKDFKNYAAGLKPVPALFQIKFCNKLFLLMLRYGPQQKILHAWVYFLGTEKESKSFSCRVTILAEDNRELSFTGPVCSIDLTGIGLNPLSFKLRSIRCKHNISWQHLSHTKDRLFYPGYIRDRCCPFSIFPLKVYQVSKAFLRF